MLLFSPIACPASQYPGWLQAINQWLPFVHMANVVRAALAPTLVPGAVTGDYLILAAWTAGGWLAAAWVVGRRR